MLQNWAHWAKEMIFLELVPHFAIFVLPKKYSERSSSFFCVVGTSELLCHVVRYNEKRAFFHYITFFVSLSKINNKNKFVSKAWPKSGLGDPWLALSMREQYKCCFRERIDETSLNDRLFKVQLKLDKYPVHFIKSHSLISLQHFLVRKCNIIMKAGFCLVVAVIS